MFPLKDNIPAKHFPAVNLWLILVNVLCFIYEVKLGHGLEEFVRMYGFIPARFLYLQERNIVDVSRFVPVFSSMFLHANFMHLLGNVWMLWIFGDNVEDRMGHLRYFFFYILCGIMAVVAQAWSGPNSAMPMLGASGAIAGVLGAYLLLYPKARILTLVPIVIFFYLVEIPAFVFLGIWFLIQFVQGYYLLTFGSLVEGGVAFWAHIGGFAAGVFFVYFFTKRKVGRK
ncbi:MAG: rhomboid family intramembrane serine protease [Proteobacteria bacterium]|nr:rhomboid family intramembrane serine protease [Pseudomonadota bacterium]MBU1710969.1 rhomboid family intramembrane serine protease [Pseudomonadota bacterium]